MPETSGTTKTSETPEPSEALTPRARILAAYQKYISPYMTTLALVYLVIFSAQSIFYEPQDTWFGWMSAINYGIWAIFVFDLVFRFILTSPKHGFAKANWLDIITVVFPQLRALRGLRAFTGPSIINRHGRSAVTGRGIGVAVAGAIIIVWVGSLMVLNAERSARGASITNFGDALWWAMETVTTVGYGDVVPVTSQGRFIATGVMILGISVLGAVTATLSASLARQSGHLPAPAQEIMNELNELKAMVASLQAHVGALPAQASQASQAPPS